MTWQVRLVFLDGQEEGNGPQKQNKIVIYRPDSKWISIASWCSWHYLNNYAWQLNNWLKKLERLWFDKKLRIYILVNCELSFYVGIGWNNQGLVF